MTEIAHGGDLREARRLAGGAAESWIDLSTGINPVPYPLPPLDSGDWSALPQPEALDALLAAARRAYGLAAAGGIVAGPGTQALIQALPRLRPGGGTLAVVAPTYAEHEAVWRRAGFAVERIAGPGAAVPGRHRVLTVVNPNNPDGRRWRPAELRAVAGEMARGGGLTIVDEAFADVDPEVSLAPEAEMAGLLVLRSFGKMYGLAGLRLGFALGDPKLADALAREIGPWAVSGPALRIGTEALNDNAWLHRTREDLAARRRALDAVLARGGLTVAGGTDLFRLVELAEARALQRHLARDRLWTRAFDDHPRWLRLGLCPDDAALARLEASLGAWSGRAPA